MTDYTLARQLERPLGRNGGRRDGNGRTTYAYMALRPADLARIDREAAERGFSRGAFLGMLVEQALARDPGFLDDLLAGTIDPLGT